MQAMQSRTASEVGQELAFKSFHPMQGGIDSRGNAPCEGIAEGVGLAHDASNLLGALSLYSELLASPGVLHDEHRGVAAELRLLSDRSWAIIDRLVNHTQSQIKIALHREQTALPEVVERCRGLLNRIGGRPVEICFGAGAYALVNVKAEAVERILLNLVKNAAAALDETGSISVSVKGALNGTAQRVTMAVQDTGRGMSSATVRRLMQAGGVSAGARHGLGFRVVRELAAMSGGGLTVMSRVGEGTRISVEWDAITR